MDAPVALVTGASRGVGRGVANALTADGFTVYATGRSIEAADLPESVRRLRCDHQDDAQTAAVFDAVAARSGKLDVLVNSAWGGYERMVENGVFTWGAPFWEQPLHRWTSMMDAGVRAAFVASGHAARMMIPAKSGLIVNISFWAAQRRVGNVLYGIAKAATDKLTADASSELKAHNVAMLSLHPGLVRTESVVAAAQSGAFDLSTSESPEFTGRVIAALQRDPNLMAKSGAMLVAAAAARHYGVVDLDGKSPPALTLADIP